MISSRARSRRTRFLGLAFILASGLWLVLFLSTAWKQSVRREAYLPELEEMARRNPDDGRLLALLGARLMEAQEHTAAAGTFERAIADGEINEDLFLSFAASTVAAGDVSRAQVILQSGAQALPESAKLRTLLERVEALPTTTSPGAIAQTICPDGPTLLIAQYARGSLFNGYFVSQGRRNPEHSGFATRQTWAAQQPDDPEVLRLWGLALGRNRRIVEAGETLRRAVELAPKSFAARVAFADLLNDTGFQAKSGQQYMQALAIQPDGLPALLGLGELSLQQSLRYAKACFEKATKLSPNLPDAWIGLGRACLQSETTTKEAVQAFETASRLVPDATGCLLYYATALEKQGHTDKAEEVVRRRIAAAPEDGEAHFRLSALLSQNNPTPERETEAEKEGREALRIVPESVGAKSQLGELLLRRGNVKEAAVLLEAADKADPFVVNTKNFLARAYARIGRSSESETLLKRAAALFAVQQRISALETQRKLHPNDISLVDELGILYTKNGQMDRADVSRDLARQMRKNPAKVAADLERLQKLAKEAGLSTP